MALIVSPQVVHSLHSNPERLGQFVAACTERSAQLFTGNVNRPDDVEAFVKMLDALWDVNTPRGDLRAYRAHLQTFPEISGEDEIVDHPSVAAGLAAIILLRALNFRVDGDVQEALLTAHSALTLAGMHDRNFSGTTWRASEEAEQLFDSSIESDQTDTRRRRCFELARNRLEALMAPGS